MKYSNHALTVLAMAPTASSWSYGLTPLSRQLLSPADMIRHQRALMDRAFGFTAGDSAFSHTSPRYEIVNEEDKLRISLDVPGVKAEDIHVTIEENGQLPYLTIAGHREVNKEGYHSEAKFSQSFSLEPSVDIDKFSASLDKGVLILTAPKDIKKLEENVRRIPVAAAPETQDVEIETKETEPERVDA